MKDLPRAPSSSVFLVRRKSSKTQVRRAHQREGSTLCTLKKSVKYNLIYLLIH